MGIATDIILRITGQDKSAQTFAALDKRANAAASRMRSVFRSAAAGIGGALTVRAIGRTIAELGALSDRAQQAGVATDELTRLSSALNILGVRGADIDSLATAFGKMAKATGAVGMQGFKDTLAEVAQLSTEEERATALVKIFGREAGLNWLPLVRQGAEGVNEGLAGVVAAMPGITQAAANAGDESKDAFDTAVGAIKTAWSNMIGESARQWSEFVGTDIRGGAVKLAAYIIYAAKYAYLKTVEVLANATARFQKGVQTAWNAMKVLVGKMEREQMLAELRQETVHVDMSERIASIGQELERQIGLADQFAERYNKAATGAVVEKAEDLIKDTAKGAVRAIHDAANNTLISASGYEALKLWRKGAPMAARAGEMQGAAAAQRSERGGSWREVVQVLRKIDGRLEAIGTV